MPTLFAQLDAGLQDNSLSVNLTGQVSRLTDIATTVVNLIERPPTQLSNLSQAIQELPLPDLAVGSNLSTTLTALQTAIPTDFSAITGSLSTGLQQLDQTATHDLTGLVSDSLSAVLAIYDLVQTDLLCQDSTADSTSPPGSSGEAPPGETDAPPETNAPPANPPVLGNTLEQMDQSLNLLPSPLTVDSFLLWLHQRLQQMNLNALGLVRVPVLDDLRDPLETLMTWRSLTPAAIVTQMAGSVQDLRLFLQSPLIAVVAPLESELTEIQTQLAAGALGQIALDLTARLGQIKTAVESSDLSGAAPAITAIDGLLAQHQTVKTTFQNTLLPQITDASDRLSDLSTDLDDQMGRVVSLLQPNTPLDVLAPLTAGQPDLSDDQSLAEFQTWLDTIVNWLQQVVDAVDLTAIREPIRTVATTMRSAVDGLDQGMVTATLTVQELFGQLEGLLNQVDVAALVAQVEEAIQTFKTRLIQTLANLFAPVRQAIAQVITTISQGIDDFDPAAIVEALREAIQIVTGILENPSVVAALNQIRGALDAVTQQLQTLSFSPLVDQVIAAIEELGSVLSSIDTSVLSTPLQLALQAALALLPESLTPITDPLITEFGTLIDAGPAPLLATVQQQPQQLLQRVRSFQPASLIGDSLSRPYQSLLADMQAFQPSRLLEPVQQELTSLKTRLRQNADPSRALEPLLPLFQQLLQAFDALQPERLVQPLESLIQQTIQRVLEAVPLEQVFDQVDGALQRVTDVVGLGDRLKALVQRMLDLLNGLSNPQTQVNAWIEDSLANLGDITDTSPLQPLLNQVSETLSELTTPALLSRFNQAVDGVLNPLETLDAQTALVSLIQAYRGISRSAVDALPASAEKTALLAILDRFNPVQPDFSAPYQRLSAFQAQLTQVKASLPADLATWDERYHSPQTLLASLRDLTVAPDRLRQWVREALQGPLVEPLTRLFGLAAPLTRTLSVFLGKLQGLLDSLQSKVTALLQGPDSLGGIRDELRSLVERLQQFDLGFLTDSVQQVFATVRGKLEAVDPAGLAATLSAAFQQVLDSLDLSQVLPAAAIAQLDTSYEQVIRKLEELDPERLVTQVVQPEFEQKVIPLLETFDLTPLLTALLERMRQLDEELRAEMERVNAAYQTLRQSMPSISISVDVDLGGLL